jgi:hypothetical protein
MHFRLSIQLRDFVLIQSEFLPHEREVFADLGGRVPFLDLNQTVARAPPDVKLLLSVLYVGDVRMVQIVLGRYGNYIGLPLKISRVSLARISRIR